MHAPTEEPINNVMGEMREIYTPQNSNLQYWLNNYTTSSLNGNETHHAEINLTKLNEIANNCDLVGEFSWIEKQRCNKFDIE